MYPNKTPSRSQEQSCHNSCEHFMNRFHLGSFVRQSGIHKTKGIPALSVLKILFMLPFLQKSFYRQLINQHTKAYHFGKDVIYDEETGDAYHLSCGMRRMWRRIAHGEINQNTRPNIISLEEALEKSRQPQ